MVDTLYEKAQAIRQWALDKRLMPAGAVSDPVDDNAIAHVAQAFSDDIPLRLQKHGLTGVGISQKSESIVIYTAGGLFKNDKKLLPETLFDNVDIHYRRATPFTLKDDMPSAVFGEEAGIFVEKKYSCGSSISIGNRRTAGTLGCLVRDAAGKLYGLTNNHVTGGCNYTRIGMPVIAPGVKDVTSASFPPFSIGAHYRAIPMTLGEPGTVEHENNTDAAIFSIDDPDLVTSSQRSFYDTPSSLGKIVADIETGTRVKKVGRTTGLTTGFIESLNVGPMALDYDIPTHHSAHETVKFQGRVYFEPVYIIRGDANIPFSQKGDSGSLVVTDIDGEEKAVGLIFAGDTSENISYMLPLAPILDRLGVSLVSDM